MEIILNIYLVITFVCITILIIAVIRKLFVLNKSKKRNLIYRVEDLEERMFDTLEEIHSIRRRFNHTNRKLTKENNKLHRFINSKNEKENNTKK